MKLPSTNPSSNAFMVFSMLLLGVAAAALIVVFDFWFPTTKSISTQVFMKLRNPDVPMLLLVSTTGLTLLAAGFVIYLGSFFLLAIPAFLLRKLVQAEPKCDNSIFMHVSEKALVKVLPETISKLPDRRFRDIFVYMLLTSVETVNSANVRFTFTQLMFARSIGGMLVAFSAYVCLTRDMAALASTSVVLLVYALACVSYMAGLNFYEEVMASGFLIEELNEKRSKEGTPRIPKPNDSQAPSGQQESNTSLQGTRRKRRAPEL